MMPGEMDLPKQVKTLIGTSGYTKFEFTKGKKLGQKFYRCNLVNLKGMRYSKRKFKKADDAVKYGQRVVERFERLHHVG